MRIPTAFNCVGSGHSAWHFTYDFRQTTIIPSDDSCGLPSRDSMSGQNMTVSFHILLIHRYPTILAV